METRKCSPDCVRAQRRRQHVLDLSENASRYHQNDVLMTSQSSEYELEASDSTDYQSLPRRSHNALRGNISSEEMHPHVRIAFTPPRSREQEDESSSCVNIREHARHHTRIQNRRYVRVPEGNSRSARIDHDTYNMNGMESRPMNSRPVPADNHTYSMSFSESQMSPESVMVGNRTHTVDQDPARSRHSPTSSRPAAIRNRTYAMSPPENHYDHINSRSAVINNHTFTANPARNRHGQIGSRPVRINSRTYNINPAANRIHSMHPVEIHHHRKNPRQIPVNNPTFTVNPLRSPIESCTTYSRPLECPNLECSPPSIFSRRSRHRPSTSESEDLYIDSDIQSELSESESEICPELCERDPLRIPTPPQYCGYLCPKQAWLDKQREKDQAQIDRYILNKGFNYFDDLCRCSLKCLMAQICADPFIKKVFTSGTFFFLGIKLCYELDAWYIPF